jgi:hypothetical protein
MNSLPTIPLFPADKIVATSGPLALLQEANQIPSSFSRVISAVLGARSLPGHLGNHFIYAAAARSVRVFTWMILPQSPAQSVSDLCGGAGPG